MRNVRTYSVRLAVSLSGVSLLARNKGELPSDSDRIAGIAHVPLSGDPVIQLTLGVHWRRNYLYLDHRRGPVTVLDVTDPKVPTKTGTVDISNQEGNGNLSAVVGTAVVVVSSASTPAPQTVTILSLADTEHPKVAQQFSGVTSMLQDGSRGLIYLTNPEGLWVLRMEPATDVALEKEYDNYIRYNR
jgi:hypothetical protein